MKSLSFFSSEQHVASFTGDAVKAQPCLQWDEPVKQ